MSPSTPTRFRTRALVLWCASAAACTPPQVDSSLFLFLGPSPEACLECPPPPDLPLRATLAPLVVRRYVVDVFALPEGIEALEAQSDAISTCSACALGVDCPRLTRSCHCTPGASDASAIEAGFSGLRIEDVPEGLYCVRVVLLEEGGGDECACPSPEEPFESPGLCLLSDPVRTGDALVFIDKPYCRHHAHWEPSETTDLPPRACFRYGTEGQETRFCGAACQIRARAGTGAERLPLTLEQCANGF